MGDVLSNYLVVVHPMQADVYFRSDPMTLLQIVCCMHVGPWPWKHDGPNRTIGSAIAAFSMRANTHVTCSFLLCSASDDDIIFPFGASPLHLKDDCLTDNELHIVIAPYER